MNLYILVEGKKTEKLVYRSWLGHLFPDLEEVHRLEDLQGNHFLMISGDGYPNYLDRIESAFQDFQKQRVDQFLIIVDAEEETPEERKAEIGKIIEQCHGVTPTHVIVQTPCIESWFLGNPNMLKRNPHSETLRTMKAFYNVGEQDPEQMGCPSDYAYKAHYHLDYLKAMLAEYQQSYSKKKPGCVREDYYLKALIKRFDDTGHLTGFGEALSLWRTWGSSF